MEKTKTKNALPEVIRENETLKHSIIVLESRLQQLERELLEVEEKIKALS